MVGAFTQKAFAILVFLGAIGTGIHLASRAVGQTSPHINPSPIEAPINKPNEQNTAPTASDVQTPAPMPTAPPLSRPFVPSEVEAYVPIPNKIEDPRMILDTSMGKITIRLFPAVAPVNVRNIVELARGNKEFIDAQTSKKARRPYFENMTFHRVIPGFLIQAGCPFGNGRGGPGYTLPDEINPSMNFQQPGMVAMAPQRSGKDLKKDTNGSQFFITLGPMPDGNGKFTIIGKVERGMDVVQRISRVRTGPTDRPIRKVFLNHVEIVDRSGLYDRDGEKKPTSR